MELAFIVAETGENAVGSPEKTLVGRRLRNAAETHGRDVVEPEDAFRTLVLVGLLVRIQIERGRFLFAQLLDAVLLWLMGGHREAPLTFSSIFVNFKV